MSDSARDSAGDSAVPAAPAEPAARAYRSVWAWVLFLVPAVLGLGADLWLKNWSFPLGVPADATAMHLAGRNPATTAPMPVIPHVLAFTTTANQGAVFGIGQGKVMWFLGFSVLAAGIIVWVFATSGARQRVVHFALGLIMAGALGNMYDRAVFHGVRDMLKLQCFVWGGKDWYPYIFNVADVLLCLGVPLLIARWMLVKDEGATGTRRPDGVKHP